APYARNQVDPGLSAVRARVRQEVPRLRDRHPRSALRAGRRRQTLSGGLRRARIRPMIPRSVKAPTIPIPFHKLLRVVAIVDQANRDTRLLLDQITAANFEVEICDSFERDASEDAGVGAYIALIDGNRLEGARKLAAAVRGIGFRTPLWALADSHRI